MQKPPRISLPVYRLDDSYDAIVIGSGYGGAIAASRLARAGRRVCVLERGREIRPGEYPDTLEKATEEFQVDDKHLHVGKATGLYDLRVNDDINVFIGCGLGGTSLVNANVALYPDKRVFQCEEWPAQIRQEAAGGDDTELGKGFRRALDMLEPEPHPDTPVLRKLNALCASAEQLGLPCGRPPLTVKFADGVSRAGVPMSRCENCGDCVSGCNYGAKGTVLMNYLPDARSHGAEIVCEAPVVRVAEAGNGGWLVFVAPTGIGRSIFDAPPIAIRARIVVVAAGALGSTEILLRSQAAGLPLSAVLGHGFTGNADALAFGYNNITAVNGLGFGDRSPGSIEPVGTCISGFVDGRDTEKMEDGLVMEEGALPGALSFLLPGIFAASSAAFGEPTRPGLVDRLRAKARELVSAVRGAYHGAVRNTQTYLVMGHDDAGGRMFLRDDRLRIEWKGVAEQGVFKAIAKQVKAAVAVHGGTYIENPIAEPLLGETLVTVHPLGGCGMAETADKGVIDHRCRVFRGDGEAIHDGLLVTDGAAIPRSLGVNPFLTISALAERAMALLAAEKGWSLDTQSPSGPPPPAPEPKLGIQFTEAMRGFVSDAVADDFEAAAKRGEAEGSRFEFILSIISDDLDHMLEDPAHDAAIIGVAMAPKLSPHPLSVTNGQFQLFVQDGPRERRMIYRMRLTDQSGRHWFFNGEKFVHDDSGLDVWAETTTLFVTIHDGEDDRAAIAYKGVLRIKADDLARQVKTIRVRNAASVVEEAEALGRFGQFFAGALAEAFVGVGGAD